MLSLLLIAGKIEFGPTMIVHLTEMIGVNPGSGKANGWCCRTNICGNQHL